MKDVDEIVFTSGPRSPPLVSYFLKFVVVAAKVEKVKQEDLVSYSEGRDGQNCKGYWS